MSIWPLKRLNRLRKIGQGELVQDYAETNLRQNWKAIEDTFRDNFNALSGQARELQSQIQAINSLTTQVSDNELKHWVSSLVASFTTTSTSFVDTGLEVTFTNTKNRLLLRTINDQDAASGVYSAMGGVGGLCGYRWLINGSIPIEYQTDLNSVADKVYELSAYAIISPGTNTVKLQTRQNTAQGVIINKRIMVMELPDLA